MVAVLVPLLATHSGPVGDIASPHGLTRSESAIRAFPVWSETWLITRKCGLDGAGVATAQAGVPARMVSAPPATQATVQRNGVLIRASLGRGTTIRPLQPSYALFGANIHNRVAMARGSPAGMTAG